MKRLLYFSLEGIYSSDAAYVVPSLPKPLFELFSVADIDQIYDVTAAHTANILFPYNFNVIKFLYIENQDAAIDIKLTLTDMAGRTNIQRIPPLGILVLTSMSPATLTIVPDGGAPISRVLLIGE